MESLFHSANIYSMVIMQGIVGGQSIGTQDNYGARSKAKVP